MTPTPHHDDISLTPDQIQALSSADQLADFFTLLRYPADTRMPMTADALSLNKTLANATRRVERLTSVERGALEVYLFELTSVTVAHTRALARAFRTRAGNFLLVLTDDYRRIDFVLLEREIPGLTEGSPTRRGIIVRPRVLSVDRRDPDRVALRVLRRFTFTEYDTDGRPDPYAQYDKLSSAYTIAEWSEPLFNNRALFSDYYLNQRLPELPEWDAEARNQAFRQIRGVFAQARRRFAGQDAATARQELIQPLLEALGFRPEPGPGGTQPDFYLHADGADGPSPEPVEGPSAFVLAYPWNRYLDGKDEARDDERPEENPGAQVVSLLEAGEAPWGIVTNGKLWRLYSARAHSRATNYYEVNLEETLASPDPGRPFRYFYLFFRADAFVPQERAVAGEARELAFLDWLMEESDTYARELGERLKERVFERIFPHLAEGFIAGLGGPEALLSLPEAERQEQLQLVFQGTLTFLYRLLFLLYAESRDLLPVREVRGYYQVSLQRLKEEIAQKAGPLEDQVAERLGQAYGNDQTGLYQRLLDLFAVIDRGSASRNVPAYNGGLFVTEPAEGDAGREAQASRFLQATPVPDRYLALGLDRLARDVDPKRGDLGFIDYKSLGVRQLGSIYEGLLEFKVQVAPEKMAVVDGTKTEEVLPYAEAKRKKRKILTTGRGAGAAERTLPKGTVYLENDRRERKATGSYYTPDYIVKYIVRQAVGPVLDEKLDDLGPRMREAESRFRAAVRRKQEMEGVTPDEPALLGNVAGDVLRDLFDVKVLDPAMGSGHFLVEAVDYVTDRLVRFLDGYPFLGVFFGGMRQGILEEMEGQRVTVDPARLTDVTLLKRHVLKRCIYGVDLNPMAVELAKVSLWLDCFTLGAPLSFLDHHLRCGNSLIGAMAREVEAEMSGPASDGQMTFLTGPFVGLLRAAEIMRGISAIADVTLEQVRESGSLFQAFDRAAKPYKQLLDVYVAQHFGVEHAKGFLADQSSEQALATVQADPDTAKEPYGEVVRQARALYRDKRFFHWDLEFPEVFINLEQTTWKKTPGFDAVVGNPPYVNANELNKVLSEFDKPFWKTTFQSASGAYDLYILFLEQAVKLTRSGSFASMITPNKFLSAPYAEAFRKSVSQQARFLRLFNLSRVAVFEDPSIYPVVSVFQSTKPETDYQVTVETPFDPSNVSETRITSQQSSKLDALPDMIWGFLISESLPMLLKADSVSTQLQHCSVVRASSTASESDDFERALFNEPEDHYKKFINTGLIERYESLWGIQTLTHKGNTFETPYLNLKHLAVSEDREEQYSKAKIIFAKLAKRVEGFPDLEGEYASANTNFAYDTDYDLRYIGSVLNSRLLSIVYDGYFGALIMSGGYFQFQAPQLRVLPIRRIHFTTSQAERERLVADLVARYERAVEVPQVPGTSVSEATVPGTSQTAVPFTWKGHPLLAQVETLLPRDAEGQFLAFQPFDELRTPPGATGAEEHSDVVHDLLAHLAERMIDMHKQKQARVEAFWQDLEAATDPKAFDTLRNKGKWEQSLSKDPACRPYVDPESRSTRHLDESLGWDEDCFAAFAGMLAGRSSVTPPLLDVYRAHHPPYQALVGRITATDRLIDQIVYRLYGLTEEEIAVVES